MNSSSYSDLHSLLKAPRSAFFGGRTQDTVDERRTVSPFRPSTEAMFTQSNARVLIGHAANGSFRMIALPTQVYPAPTKAGEFGLGPGMYHQFDVAMYGGDLAYHIVLNDDETIALDAESRDNRTVYADDFLPFTYTRTTSLNIGLFSLAPVAPDAATAALSPAPLPGPAGALYVLCLRNTSDKPLAGKVLLRASDLLIGHYEDADSTRRAEKRPHVDLHKNTLILTRPNGAVGVHLQDGKWTHREAPFCAERAFQLNPGEELTFETRLAVGATYADIMPTIFALNLRTAFDWLNRTADFWHERLGSLTVSTGTDDDAGGYSRDIYVRSLLDNFNCLQTDAQGHLIAHWQGAPSHGYGVVWGIDVEPTAVSIVNICPELARQSMQFFMTRSRVPRGTIDHSIPILVAPIVIARQWLQSTGDVAYLRDHPDIMQNLEAIMLDLMAMQSAGDVLFPSRYSSDGPVGRRYDYGTNVKVWYAFDSMDYIFRLLHRSVDAQRCADIAAGIRAAIERHMVCDGTFGKQISGGTNLGEDPGKFYLADGVPYYDGEDTSSMLAPTYGVCDFTNQRWINYHRFARSLWCSGFDPEFGILLWNPAEPGVVDGTAFFSRLGGAVTPLEMQEALSILREKATDEVTGSVFWWGHGEGNKRALTRCSQGQGAWAWQYLQQWLGLQVDTPTRTLTLAPRGLPTKIEWVGFRAGSSSFDVHWHEAADETTAQIRNNNNDPWHIRVGFRQPGAGALGEIRWQEAILSPGESITLSQGELQLIPDEGLTDPRLAALECAAFSEDGVLFKRYGPAHMWTNWAGWSTWSSRELPLSIRFALVNGSGEDWHDVCVRLRASDSFTISGRLTRQWSKPTISEGHSAEVDVGYVPAASRATAAFWLWTADAHHFAMSWNSDRQPFHQTSQPTDDITLYSLDRDAGVEGQLQAVLEIVTSGGRSIEKVLPIHLRICPQT